MGFILDSAAVAIIVLLIWLVKRWQQRGFMVHQNGFQDPRTHRVAEPFTGLDLQMKMHMDVPYLFQLHQRYGKTFQTKPFVVVPAIYTIAPENIRVVNTSGKDWGIEPSRLPGMEYFCGQGFLTTDGDRWQNSRKLLKPAFSKNNLLNLDVLSGEVDSLLSNLQPEGTTVDLQPLLYNMVRDTVYFWWWLLTPLPSSSRRHYISFLELAQVINKMMLLTSHLSLLMHFTVHYMEPCSEFFWVGFGD